jgi:hypothetical protein
MLLSFSSFTRAQLSLHLISSNVSVDKTSPIVPPHALLLREFDGENNSKYDDHDQDNKKDYPPLSPQSCGYMIAISVNHPYQRNLQFTNRHRLLSVFQSADVSR